MKRGNLYILLIALAALLFAACAPTRYVRPIPKGDVALGGSFGGPMMHFGGITMPIPFLTVQGGYGIDSTLTAFAGLGVTSAMYGVIQTDLGVTKAVIQPKGARPGLSISPAVNLNLDVHETQFTFYPQLDVNAWWEYREKRPDFVYVGVTNWFELQSTRAHDQDQPSRWIPGFQAGHCWSLAHADWRLEAKYLAPFTDNFDTVVWYANPANKGGIGMYVTFAWRIGK